MNKSVDTRSVGQVVKTLPSHGRIRGSTPLQTAIKLSDSLWSQGMQIFYNNKRIWSVGQVVKTLPSHGRIRGSTPLQTV